MFLCVHWNILPKSKRKTASKDLSLISLDSALRAYFFFLWERILLSWSSMIIIEDDYFALSSHPISLLQKLRESWIIYFYAFCPSSCIFFCLKWHSELQHHLSREIRGDYTLVSVFFSDRYTGHSMCVTFAGIFFSSHIHFLTQDLRTLIHSFIRFTNRSLSEKRNGYFEKKNIFHSIFFFLSVHQRINTAFR